MPTLRDMGPRPAGRALTFEVGNEFAPDAPWGSDHLWLRQDGAVRYENRDHGRQRVVAGSLALARVSGVFAALDASSFPKVPDHRIPPGASLAELTLEEENGQTASQRFHYYFAESLPGYDDLLAMCTELAKALRTSDSTVLAAWGFKG